MIEVDVIQGMIGRGVSVIENHADPRIKALPIKVPGRTFNPPNDSRYFELILIQNNGLLSTPRLWVGSDPTWGDDKTFKGILRIILHWNLDDTGIYEQARILATLAQSFKKGTNIFNGEAVLQIFNHPSLTDVIETSTELLFPLTIPYQCFHSPATV